MDQDWQKLGMAAAAAMNGRNFRDAAPLLAQLVALRPDHADSWYNLGYVRRQLGDFGGALDAYAAALAQGLSGGEAAHVNRAILLANHLGRPDEAKSELDRALQLNAGFLPAWLNLGELYEDQGDAARARSAYDRALRIMPGNGRAQARLAALAVADGDAHRAVTILETRCQQGLGRDQDAVEILFAYGNALDATARYDDAFAAIAMANELSASLRPSAARYNPARTAALVDALCALDAGDRSAADEADDPQPLFICGMFRSGSTVFEQLLARHPAIGGGGELETIPALVHRHFPDYPAGLDAIAPDAVVAMRADYVQALALAAPQGRLVTDKRPDNFLHIGLIKRLFPAAKIIVTRRAPLDNLLSIFFLNFADTINYSDQIAHIVHYMEQYERLMAHWAALYGGDIRFVDYEKLVTEPEAVLAPLHDWLGLAAPADLLDAAPAIIRTPSNWQARGPLHQKSVGRWRNYERALAPFRARLMALSTAQS